MKQSRQSRQGTTPKKIVRYAVVGLGHIAQVAVLPGFAHARNSQLVALVSGEPKKLKKLGKKYGVSLTYSYEQYDECLRSGAIDAVYIALPNDMHREYAIRAAKAGIHVLCEKPLAVSVRDGEAMLEASVKNHVKLMTAYRLHFEPANLSTMELVRSGRLGEPRYFNSTFSFQLTDPANIRLKEARGGGAIFDIGTYCINAARYLFSDEPTEVFAMTVKSGDPRFKEVDETTSIILRFPKERLASFTVSFGSSTSGRYELVGTKGSVVLDPAYEYSSGLKQTVTINDRPREKKFAHTDQFGGEIEAFSEWVLERLDPEPSAAEGIADLRVIEAIRRSMRTGRAVKLDLFKKSQRPGKKQEKRKPAIKEPELVEVESPHD
jgi:glucose-fructose oxidoreductase